MYISHNKIKKSVLFGLDETLSNQSITGYRVLSYWIMADEY